MIYGKKLADALNAKDITHMGENNTYPVGENEIIIPLNAISENADKIQKLIETAKEIQDPRLLLIERTGATGKVSITTFTFGTITKQVDAGSVYEWKFDEKKMKELKKFIVQKNEKYIRKKRACF